MSSKKKVLLILLVLINAINVVGKDITLVSDPYPPYVLDEPGKKGYVTDIAMRAFELAGYEAVYKNVPFKRAVVEVESGTYDAILAIAKGGRENFVYPETTLGAFNNKFFKRPGDDWEWKGNIEDLEDRTLGFLLGYSIGNDEFKNYIEDDANSDKIDFMPGSSGLERNLLKLVAKRIDLIIDDEMVVRYTAKQKEVSDKIVEAGVLKDGETSYVSIGFHKNNPNAKEYTAAFDKGIKMMKENGDLKDILNTYGLKEF